MASRAAGCDASLHARPHGATLFLAGEREIAELVEPLQGVVHSWSGSSVGSPSKHPGHTVTLGRTRRLRFEKPDKRKRNDRSGSSSVSTPWRFFLQYLIARGDDDA